MGPWGEGTKGKDLEDPPPGSNGKEEEVGAIAGGMGEGEGLQVGLAEVEGVGGIVTAAPLGSSAGRPLPGPTVTTATGPTFYG